MPETSTEPDSIIRNFRLVASWWNLFVFVINPALSWVWLFYTVFSLIHYPALEKIISNHGLVCVALAYMVAAHALEVEISGQIKTRLAETGYSERRTRAREADLGLNIAVLGASWYGLTILAEDGNERSWLWIGGSAVLRVLILETAVFLLLLGPTLWYTVRAR